MKSTNSPILSPTYVFLSCIIYTSIHKAKQQLTAPFVFLCSCGQKHSSSFSDVSLVHEKKKKRSWQYLWSFVGLTVQHDVSRLKFEKNRAFLGTKVLSRDGIPRDREIPEFPGTT